MRENRRWERDDDVDADGQARPPHPEDDEPVGISTRCLFWATSIALVFWLMLWAVVATIARYV